MEQEISETAVAAVLPTPDHPCYQAWREYALSGISRGEIVASVLADHRPLAGLRLVDVGCGDGGLAVALARRGTLVVGMDIDLQRVLAAARRAREARLPVLPIVGDALHLPILAETADVVICNDVIEHVSNAARCLAEAQRSLHADGLLYAAVPSRWSLPNLWSDPHYRLPLVASLPRRWAAPLVTHVWRRNPTYDVEALLSWQQVRRLLIESGFVICDRRSHLLDWRLQYLLQKLRGEVPVVSSTKRHLQQFLKWTGLNTIAVGALSAFLAIRWHYWVRGWAIVARPSHARAEGGAGNR